MRELRLVMLGLAAVMLLLLAAGFVGRALHPHAQPRNDVDASTRPAAVPRVAVEAAIADAPDYARFFDRLRLAFPSDYETIVASLALGPAQRGAEPDADAMMADAVTALRRVHGPLAAKASEAALQQIFASNLREMNAMGEVNPQLCVAFLFGAGGSGFSSFVADAAIAGLDAISSGRTEQVARTAPSDADFQLLDRALVAKGLSRPQIEALLDGKTADPPIPDAEMCRAGQTYLATLAELPEASRDRLYALAVNLM